MEVHLKANWNYEKWILDWILETNILKNCVEQEALLDGELMVNYDVFL